MWRPGTPFVETNGRSALLSLLNPGFVDYFNPFYSPWYTFKCVKPLITFLACWRL